MSKTLFQSPISALTQPQTWRYWWHPLASMFKRHSIAGESSVLRVSQKWLVSSLAFYTFSFVWFIRLINLKNRFRDGCQSIYSPHSRRTERCLQIRLLPMFHAIGIPSAYNHPTQCHRGGVQYRSNEGTKIIVEMCYKWELTFNFQTIPINSVYLFVCITTYFLGM